MPVHAWLLIAVLGLSLAAPSLAQEAPAQEEQGEQETPEQPAIAPAPVAPAVLATPDTARTELDARLGLEGEAQEGPGILGDTWPQWIMAVTGVFAFFLSALAVWLLKRTLDATRDALKEAKLGTEAATDAAVAAQRANEIAAATASIDQRPWLAIGTPKINYIYVAPWGLDGMAWMMWMNIEWTLQNTGKTPAVGVLSYAHAVIEEGSGDTLNAAWTAFKDTLNEPTGGNQAVAPSEVIPDDRGLSIAFNQRRGPPHTDVQVCVMIGARYRILGDDTPRCVASRFFVSQPQGGPDSPLLGAVRVRDAHFDAHFDERGSRLDVSHISLRRIDTVIS